MKTNILRSVAVALSIGACTTAQAQYGDYQSPAKWNNFNVNRAPNAGVDFFHTVAAGEDKVADGAKKKAKKAVKEAVVEPLPAPVPEPVAQELPAPEAMVAPGHAEAMPAQDAMVGSGHVSMSDCGPCQSSPYVEAMQSGPILARPPLAPWFGGANLLFLTVEESSNRTLVINDATGDGVLSTGDVDASATTGFDIFAGRYLDCGRYGLSIGYFLFNPEEETAIVNPAAPGGYRAAFSSWNNISAAPGPATVYDHYDLAPASGYRARRDMRFQGIEVNLSSFGIMGAQRAAPMCGTDTALGNKLARFGRGIGLGNNCYGRGGAGGPLVRACNGRVQVITSHGFRWFQMEDEFEFAANIDGSTGYQPTDMFYNVDTENNLFGYQFGGRLNYCLGCRTNFGVGGKVGIYGNDYEIRQRIGTDAAPAYITATPTDFVDTEVSDTVLSTLAEIDLGLGYRMSNAWTVRGGYRLMGICGVATSTGSIPADFSSLDSIRDTSADDCVILHGGYVGLEYNW